MKRNKRLGEREKITFKSTKLVSCFNATMSPECVTCVLQLVLVIMQINKKWEE